MYHALFDTFMAGGDTLQVYEDSRLIFSSNKDRLAPLLYYMDSPVFQRQPVVIFDKIGGNAAALLVILAHCRELYSPLGSEIAIKTLEKHGVKYHFSATVPYIRQPDGKTMCPMEKLSLDKGPEDFYSALTARRGNLSKAVKESTWTR